MAGNMGYDTYLVPDACATTDRVAFDGLDRDQEALHAASVGNMHGEFCTALALQDALTLVTDPLLGVGRVQGNEQR